MPAPSKVIHPSSDLLLFRPSLSLLGVMMSHPRSLTLDVEDFAIGRSSTMLLILAKSVSH